jgi:hypothetical protein
MGRQLVWSSTRIDAANYCNMRYYLKYSKPSVTSLRLSAYLKGNVLHKLIEKFWNRLGDPSKVSKRGPIRYSNAEEFAEHALGMWDNACIRAENSKRPVTWRFEKERWAIRNGSENVRGLEEICLALFPILVEEGPPLHSELEFRFNALGKRFRGKIDEIRTRGEKLILRDYKSGRPFMGEMKLKHDPQLTMYNAAVVSLIREKEIARKLGLLQFREQFMQGFDYINPDFQEEFFLVEAPVRIEQQKEQGKDITAITIHPTTRTDNHFLEVVKMIDVVQNRVNGGLVVAERGRKCEDCDVKYDCEKRLGDVGKGFMADQRGQFCMDYIIPEFAKKPQEKRSRKRKRDPAQKHFAWRHNRKEVS